MSLKNWVSKRVCPSKRGILSSLFFKTWDFKFVLENVGAVVPKGF